MEAFFILLVIVGASLAGACNRQEINTRSHQATVYPNSADQKTPIDKTTPDSPNPQKPTTIPASKLRWDGLSSLENSGFEVVVIE